ncbi:MAG: glycerol-3-phosphate dehydrogenase [Flavobacteriaceae bacterium]|nr:glycerol-3-phosphate dehydrogenase [Flavobacteriaceae bacterium]|tara:strand:+ start:19276 stop:20280 length:1005 start_codon:yes stop_codon:yes gene_type:complete
MKETKLKFGVIGSGSWATALIKILSENNGNINWYIRNIENIDFIKKNSHNPNYLSSVELNLKKLKISAEINEVVEASDVIIIAIPSEYVNYEMKKIDIDISNKIIICALKGLVPETDLLFGEHMQKYYGISIERFLVIGGPCHAEEVALEKLSYLTIGSTNLELCKIISKRFKCKYIKVKASDDIIGIEYASMLKNIFALAVGISNGLGYGDNYQSVLMSNSIKEMKRFISKRHKIKRNINNSAYLGDLLVTGYSSFSRNRMFGNMIGKGYTIKAAQLEMKMVAEGYIATKKAYLLNFDSKKKAKTPIIDAVYKILYEKRSAKKIFKDLSDIIS